MKNDVTDGWQPKREAGNTSASEGKRESGEGKAKWVDNRKVKKIRAEVVAERDMPIRFMELTWWCKAKEKRCPWTRFSVRVLNDESLGKVPPKISN